MLLAAIGFTLAALPAAFVPGWMEVWYLAVAVAVLIATADAMMARARLMGWRVALTGRASCPRGRTGTISLRLERPEGDAGGRILCGLELPEGLEPNEDAAAFDLPPGGGAHQFGLEVTARERGNHLLGSAHLELASAFRLWVVRGGFRLDHPFLVPPDITRERRAFAAAFLPRHLAGLKLQRQLGRGREFDKLRDYQPGDGFDEIHWKATARRSKPVTKTFQVETTQEVHVLLDASRLSGRRLPDDNGVQQTVLERQVVAALALAGLAKRQGDRFGLILYADQVLASLAARSGPAHFSTCRDTLALAEVRPVSPDPKELFTHVAARLRRRSLLLLMTDLSDEVGAEQYLRHLPLLTRRHLVLVVQPQPPQLAPVFRGPAPSTERQLQESLAWHWEWETMNRALAGLSKVGARGLLASGPDYVTLVMNRYLNLRQRQAL